MRGRKAELSVIHVDHGRNRFNQERILIDFFVYTQVAFNLSELTFT